MFSPLKEEIEQMGQPIILKVLLFLVEIVRLAEKNVKLFYH
jgi:hypothetical protein